MASFNKVILCGNLTRSPETRYLPGGTAVTDFGLAMNRKWKDKEGNAKEEVCFVDCTAWGRTGEVIAQHFTKGRPILVEGRLRYETWDDKNGGGKRSKLGVTVETFSFVGDKGGGSGDDAGGASGRTAGAGRGAPPPEEDELGLVSKEEIPF